MRRFALFAIVGLLLAAGLGGCSRGPSASDYEVEHAFMQKPGPVPGTMADVRRGVKQTHVDLVVTIRGPAARRLGVVVTDPEGRTLTAIVEKEDLIDNVETVEGGDWPVGYAFKPGTYTVTVKFIEPEEVIYRNELELRETAAGTGGQSRSSPFRPGETERTAATAGEAVTVKLLEFDGSGTKRQAAERLAAQEEIQSLAGEHEFRLVPTSEGRTALCVGSFSREDSPELTRLLRRFQTFTTQGRKVFPDASVFHVPK